MVSSMDNVNFSFIGQEDTKLCPEIRDVSLLPPYPVLFEKCQLPLLYVLNDIGSIEQCASSLLYVDAQ